MRALLTRRLRWAADAVSLVGSAVRLVWAASPARCAATFGVQAVASLSLFFQVLLVDRALAAILGVGRSEGSVSDALVPVALLALLTAATAAGLAVHTSRTAEPTSETASAAQPSRRVSRARKPATSDTPTESPGRNRRHCCAAGEAPVSARGPSGVDRAGSVA